MLPFQVINHFLFITDVFKRSLEALTRIYQVFTKRFDVNF